MTGDVTLSKQARSRCRWATASEAFSEDWRAGSLSWRQLRDHN